MNFFKYEDFMSNPTTEHLASYLTQYTNYLMEEKMRDRKLVIGQEYNKTSIGTVNNIPEQRALNKEFFGSEFPYT